MLKNKSKNYNEFLIWTVVAKLFEALPEKYTLREIHHGGGQHDCLYVCDKNKNFQPIGIFYREHLQFTTFPDGFNNNTINRNIYRFINDVPENPMIIGRSIIIKTILSMINTLDPLPEATDLPEAYVYAFVSAVLESHLFSNDYWECRIVYVDKSGIGVGGGINKKISVFPNIAKLINSDIKEKDARFLQFWCILKNRTPVICVNKSGRAINTEGIEIMLTNVSVKDALAPLLPSYVR